MLVVAGPFGVRVHDPGGRPEHPSRGPGDRALWSSSQRNEDALS